MTLHSLKSILEKKYQVLCYYDLADINQQHSAVYKIFQQFHKEQFEHNERLVFYSAHRPSDLLLEHLQRAANLIDISSCFVMICGPHDIREKLKTISHNNDIIEYYSTNIDSKFLPDDNLFAEDTICPLPWMHLAVTNLGDCKVCCVAKTKLGSVVDQSLDSLFYSKDMDSIRSSMLAGAQPAQCVYCWNLERQNIKSNRQWHIGFYGKQFYTEWIDDPAIRSIDFRPSNVCNFKCRICSPDASSLVAQERMKLATDPKQISVLKNINLQGQWFDNDSKFINQMIDLLPSLINVDFYGGEPFLLKQLPRFLETAVNLGHAEHIRLHFNTNGSIFPDSLLCYLERFKQVDISISIDNIGKRFEFERGGEWSTIDQNRKKFDSETNFNISIAPTVNIQNVFYLDDVINWAGKNNIVFNFVDHPSYLSIDCLTPAAKELVIAKYQNHNHPELRNISNRILRSKGSNGTEFVNQMKILDQHRKQNFLESHKEIAIAMGYSV
jgi:hypothetical protein